MSYARIALAALSAFIAYFVLGGLIFTLPRMRKVFMKYPGGVSVAGKGLNA